MTVRVVTDSASCIGGSDVGASAIDIVPIHVLLGEVELAEEELRSPDLAARLSAADVLPRTSQPSPEEFVDVFRRIVSGGDEALAVLVSAGMSGTVQSAEVAAEAVRAEMPGARIAVIDSRSNSLEEGYAVLSAVDAASAGRSLDACADAARETMGRTRFLFTPHSLEQLRRGGRISGAAGLVGVMLKIAPILTAEKGATGVAGVARSHASAWRRIATLMKADIGRYGLRRATVQYFADKAGAVRFAADVIQPVTGTSVPVVPIHAVVAVHVGPAVGVVYETERPLR